MTILLQKGVPDATPSTCQHSLYQLFHWLAVTSPHLSYDGTPGCSAPTPVRSVLGHLFGSVPRLPLSYRSYYSTVFRQVVFGRPIFRVHVRAVILNMCPIQFHLITLASVIIFFTKTCREIVVLTLTYASSFHMVFSLCSLTSRSVCWRHGCLTLHYAVPCGVRTEGAVFPAWFASLHPRSHAMTSQWVSVSQLPWACVIPFLYCWWWLRYTTTGYIWLPSEIWMISFCHNYFDSLFDYLVIHNHWMPIWMNSFCVFNEVWLTSSHTRK